MHKSGRLRRVVSLPIAEKKISESTRAFMAFAAILLVTGHCVSDASRRTIDPETSPYWDLHDENWTAFMRLNDHCLVVALDEASMTSPVCAVRAAILTSGKKKSPKMRLRVYAAALSMQERGVAREELFARFFNMDDIEKVLNHFFSVISEEERNESKNAPALDEKWRSTIISYLEIYPDAFLYHLTRSDLEEALWASVQYRMSKNATQ